MLFRPLPVLALRGARLHSSPLPLNPLRALHSPDLSSDIATDSCGAAAAADSGASAAPPQGGTAGSARTAAGMVQTRRAAAAEAAEYDRLERVVCNLQASCSASPSVNPPVCSGAGSWRCQRRSLLALASCLVLPIFHKYTCVEALHHSLLTVVNMLNHAAQHAAACGRRATCPAPPRLSLRPSPHRSLASLRRSWSPYLRTPSARRSTWCSTSAAASSKRTAVGGPAPPPPAWRQWGGGAVVL